MVKILVTVSEAYPVYSIWETFTEEEAKYDPVVCIPADKLDWIKRIIKEYNEVSKYLGNLYEGDRHV